MRTILLSLAFVLTASAAHAQGMYQINASLQSTYDVANAAAYYGPYYRPAYYGGYGYGGYIPTRRYLDLERNYELRQIRYSLERQEFNQRWGRR